MKTCMHYWVKLVYGYVIKVVNAQLDLLFG